MFEFKGTSVFDIGAGYGELEYDFFAINNDEDFTAIIEYYSALLERFYYFPDGFRTVEDNETLSPNVKAAMKKHNANVCLTFMEEEYIDDISKVRRIVINREMSEGKYDTFFFHFYYLNEINYFRQGEAFRKNGFFNAAINCYTICIRHRPRDAILYANRGFSYIRTGDYDLAIDDCTQAIKLEPDNAVNIMYRGTAYSEKGDYPAAINDLSIAIKIAPDFEPPYLFRGSVYEETGDLAGARADYMKCLELDPNNRFAREKLEALDGASGSETD